MNRRLLIGFLLIVLGVFVFWLSKPSADRPSKAQLKSIAVIDTVIGKATLKNSQDEISLLSLQSNVSENDTLASDQESKVVFHLASGAQFEMAPLTKIIFEKNGAGDLANVSITILEGQVQLLTDEKTTQNFEVTKKGKSLSLGELKNNIENTRTISLPEASQIQSTPALEAPPDKKTAQIPKKKIKETSSLEQEDINKVMRNQTSFLHRCYINYMLRSQRLNLSGQVVLSFIIQPTGKVINTKVISTPIQDDQLDRCLTDVINRASFKEFSSQPILVQAYPIHLD